MKEPTKHKRKKFIAEMIKRPVAKDAAKAAGFSPASATHIMKMPDVAREIEEGISEAARAAGVTRQWVIENLKQVALRCLQGEPVRDKDGNETGEWKFDSGGANRALELLGKHLRLWGDDNSAAQLGNAVIRVLAQEAQAARLRKAERVPSESVGTSLAPGSVDGPRDKTNKETVPAPPPLFTPPPASLENV